MSSARPRRLARLRPRAPRGRRARRLLGALVVLVVVAAAVGTAVALTRPAAVAHTARFVPGVPEPATPGSPARAVRLDTTEFLPATTPAPAVLLAHGFGGSKDDLTAQAESLARAGYVVLTYTARGFGASGGDIHLDAPAYEVADASRLVDWLGTRPEVERDAPGDPRVGVAGASYGGGLALLLAGTDRRVDAVAADITWHDLATALVPGGVLKKTWAGYLFQAGVPTSPAGPGGVAALTSGCGRFAPDVCAAYRQVARDGTADAATAALLQASSPARTDGAVRAPTLLTQGEDDSLFGLGQADANARAIAATGTPVKVVWRQGGHDAGGIGGGGSGTDVAGTQAREWFDAHLRGSASGSGGSGGVTPFEVARGGPRLSSTSQTTTYVGRTYRVDGGYPGVDGHAATPVRDVTVTGPALPVAAPAGGVPAAVSSLPGLGGLLGAAAGAGAGAAASALSALPGQTAAFTSAPLTAATFVAGAPTVRLQVTALTTTDATLFVGLRDVDPAGSGPLGTLPAGLVAPLHLTGLTPGRADTVTVTLPAIGYQVAAGHRLLLTVATTDQAYALPQDARRYVVAAAGPVALPAVQAAPVGSGLPWGPWVAALAVLAALGAVGVAVTLRRRSRLVAALDPALADVPVAVQDLVKSYRDGFRAVDGVSFVVERGQVVGLLGPNGAGKTTALRVLMGLMRPTSGSVKVFGEPVVPGAPVLSRIGSFVEGAGFLPHLSGTDNLRLYWAATGRPAADAHVDVAVQVAGLGASIERTVRTYSQGMRQRLAIAQAMLGLPELLVLDEPTNGLDPPQIAEMRTVLRRYAETGRTVLVSSHLLAEVEQTCSHVVVMHRGRVVAAGTVTEVAGRGGVQLAVDDAPAATRVLAAAGIGVTAVPARRALEDVFLDLVEDRVDRADRADRDDRVGPDPHGDPHGDPDGDPDDRSAPVTPGGPRG